MHILVVDPDEAFAMLLSQELKRQGYDVDTCHAGTEALSMARDQNLDLAVLDMALEDPDVVTLAHELRGVDASIRVMLIPLMGEALAAEVTQTISVQGVLPKPFFMPDLPGLIEAALNAPIGNSGDAPQQASSDVPSSDDDSTDAPVPSPEPQAEQNGLTSVSALATAARSQVERVMDGLAQEVGADAVLLTQDQSLVAWVGQLAESEAEAVARAVIHGWQTSAEVARILGREQVRFEQSIAGGDYMLYALSVVSSVIMAVAVRGAAPLGLLRHRAREAAEKIAQLWSP